MHLSRLQRGASAIVAGTCKPGVVRTAAGAYPTELRSHVEQGGSHIRREAGLGALRTLNDEHGIAELLFCSGRHGAKQAEQARHVPDVRPHSTAGNDSCLTTSYFQIRKLASGPAVMWQPHLLQVAMVSNDTLRNCRSVLVPVQSARLAGT